MQRILLYIRSKSFVRNFFLALGSFIILLLFTFYSLRFYTKHGEGVNVPMLKNMPIDKAIALLEESGLNYEIDSVYEMKKPPGVVLDYEPDYQSFVKSGRTIYLTVNTFVAPNVNFPDIEFKSFKEASVILSNYGILIGDTIYVADVSRDVVLEAKFGGALLKAGQQIPKGSKVNLVLGNGMGESEVEIPNLIGLTKDEAQFALKGSSLSIGAITFEGAIGDTASAVIIRQSPSITDSLKTISIGSPINITLSNQ